MRKMTHIVVIVIEIVIKVREEERGDGIDRVVIEPSNKAEKNIVHILLFLPIYVVPTLPTCCTLPAITLTLSLSLTPS